MNNPNSHPILHLKLSGEQLTSGTALAHCPDAIYKTAEEIKSLRDDIGRLGISGVLLVPGGGNISRGRDYEKVKGTALGRGADSRARWGTVMNAYALSDALVDYGVPHRVLLAPGMEQQDPVRGGSVPYSLYTAQRAYGSGEVVIVGGGTGADGCTTDAAVVSYAIRQAEYGCAALAFKSTDVQGVYDKDPANHSDARFFELISAGHMLPDETASTDSFGVIDLPSRQMLANTAADVTLQIYNGNEYTITDVLHARQVGRVIGTLVMPGVVEPVVSPA